MDGFWLPCAYDAFYFLLNVCSKCLLPLAYLNLIVLTGGRRAYHQMELADRAVGLLLTLTSLSIFTYYTFWVIILVSLTSIQI